MAISIGQLALTGVGENARVLAMRPYPDIREFEEYCRKAGIRLSTLGVRALGNSRYFERLDRRMDRVRRDFERLRSYIAAHPPAEDAEQAGEDAA